MRSRPPAFDAIARPYRWLEYATFGRLLERCRFAQLPHLHDARSALILGDGDGRFLARLLAINPAIQGDVVDISEAMLTLARGRVSADAAYNFEQADIRTYRPGPDRLYDLIAAHFFLDCLTEEDIRHLIGRLGPHLASRSTWVISEFAIPAGGPGRLAGRMLIRALYLAFRILTGLRVQRLPAYASLLEQSGFVLQDVEVFLGGILRSERWVRDITSKS